MTDSFVPLGEMLNEGFESHQSCLTADGTGILTAQYWDALTGDVEAPGIYRFSFPSLAYEGALVLTADQPWCPTQDNSGNTYFWEYAGSDSSHLRKFDGASTTTIGTYDIPMIQAGLTWHPVGGMLWAKVRDGFGGDEQLWKISPTTGAVVVIDTLVQVYDRQSPVPTPDGGVWLSESDEPFGVNVRWRRWDATSGVGMDSPVVGQSAGSRPIPMADSSILYMAPAGGGGTGQRMTAAFITSSDSPLQDVFYQEPLWSNDWSEIAYLNGTLVYRLVIEEIPPSFPNARFAVY